MAGVGLWIVIKKNSGCGRMGRDKGMDDDMDGELELFEVCCGVREWSGVKAQVRSRYTRKAEQLLERERE